MQLSIVWGYFLVLGILLPTVLRPFFKKLQNIDALVMLSVLSLVFISALFFAQGLSLLLLIAAAISLFVFITNIPYIIRFITNVKTDYYSPFFMIISILSILLIGGAFFIFWQFRPQTISHEVMASYGNVETEITQSRYENVTYTMWSKKENQTDVPVKAYIIYMRESYNAAKDRNNTMSVLAAKGYTIITADMHAAGIQENMRIKPFLERAAFYTNRSSRNDTGFIQSSGLLLHTIRQNIANIVPQEKRPIAEIPLFIFAEGRALGAVEAYLSSNNSKNTAYAPIQGVYALISASDDTTLLNNKTENSYITMTIKFAQEGVAPQAINADFFIVQEDPSHLPEFADITSLYVLEAKLLGAERDVQCKNAVLSANLCDAYFTKRILYEK